jgi:hypothetical protein
MLELDFQYHLQYDCSMSEKARENRLRRMAERQGYRLRRSRRRDPLARDYGLYWILEPKRDRLVVRGSGFDNGMTIDEAEAWLNRPIKSRELIA